LLASLQSHTVMQARLQLVMNYRYFHLMTVSVYMELCRACSNDVARLDVACDGPLCLLIRVICWLAN